MAVARKGAKMRRTQICFTDRQWEVARQLAESKGVSVGQAVRDLLDAAEQTLEESERKRREAMWSIVGILEGADPTASVRHDEILYGHNESAQ